MTQSNTPKTPLTSDPSRNRPLADALGGLKQQLRQAAHAQQAALDAQSALAHGHRATAGHSSSPSLSTAHNTAKHKQPDPFATIEQPHNAPLPKPLAQALDALVPRVQTRLSPAAPASPVAPRPPAASFADLMREQARQPAPSALQEKINWGEQAPPDTKKINSTPEDQFKNWREIDYTHPINRKSDAPTSPRLGSTPLPHATVHNGLQDLKTLHKAYKTQQAQQQAKQAKTQAQTREKQAAHHAFLQAVGPVKALADAGKLLHHQPRDPIPTQRQLDEQAVLREALSDEFDAGTLLDTDEALSFLRPGVSLDVARKLRKGEWTIQKQVDLHGMRIDEAREALSSFIRECYRTGLRCVRVIHGKGLGSPGKMPVLKSRVNRWLVQKAEVMAFVQANPNQGGHGAVVVLLRASR